MTTIRLAQLADAPALLSIYAHYVEHTVITFEYETPTLAEFEKRIQHIQKDYPYLVCEIDHDIVGYAYAHRHMGRAAYQWNAELSVYLRKDAHGKGIGKALYTALLNILQVQGVKTAIACITLPNPSSLALHKRFGFTEFGILRKAGYKHGAWRDVIWMKKEVGAHACDPQPYIPIGQIPDDRIQELLRSALLLLPEYV